MASYSFVCWSVVVFSIYRPAESNPNKGIMCTEFVRYLFIATIRVPVQIFTAMVAVGAAIGGAETAIVTGIVVFVLQMDTTDELDIESEDQRDELAEVFEPDLPSGVVMREADKFTMFVVIICVS